MNIDPEQEEQLFEAACAIADPRKRSVFLQQACGGNQQLREAVDRLLSCDETDDAFLETPAIGLTPDLVDHHANDEIDNYRLVEKIGAGGFGVVWNAKQIMPVKRRVAVKIIRLGMDTEQILQRFELERQTLAMMSHPNIATILDAGTTRLGRPYFVMELVQGKSLDTFCDAFQSSIQQRLRLFIDVCRAVQHAHLKGIVHRDLKPSNILVAEVEGRPVPKVIDFGIAKALPHVAPDAALGETAHQVTAGAVGNQSVLAGTPDYMSPEQVAGSTDVDTRADIYALGSVLQTLLVGEPPKRSAEQPAEQTNGESVSWTMSECVARSSSAEELAAHRGVNLTQLLSRIKTELQWIVDKATAHEAGERYQNVGDLVGDLERHLAGLPLSVSPTGLTYRIKKFVGRNSLATLLSLVATLAVIGGSIAAIIGFAREREARVLASVQEQRAEDESRRAALEEDKAMRFTQLLEKMMDAADPSSGRPADKTLRDELKDFANLLTEQLTDFPVSEARMQRTVGRLFRSLRQYDESGPHLKRAYQLRKEHLAENAFDLVQSQIDVAETLFYTGHAAESERLLLPAMAALRENDISVEQVEATALLSRLRRSQGRSSEASELMYEAWQNAVSLKGDMSPMTLMYQAKAARKLLETGRKEASLKLATEALENLLKVRPADHIDVAQVKRDLGLILRIQKDFDAAERMARESLAVYRELTGENSIFAASSLILLARVLRDAGRIDEAREAGREAIAISEETSEGNDYTKWNAYDFIAAHGIDEETLAAETKALEIRRKLRPPSAELASAHYKFAFKLRTYGKYDAAMEQYDLSFETNRQVGIKRLRISTLSHAKSEVYAEAGDRERAQALLRQGVSALSEERTPLNVNEQVSLSIICIELAGSFISEDRIQDAVQQLTNIRRFTVDAETPLPALLLALQAQLDSAGGKVDEAEEKLVEALRYTSSEGQALRLQIRIDELLADCEIAQGEVDAAEDRLQELLTRKRTAWFRKIDMRRAQFTLLRLAKNEDQKEKAIQLQKELILGNSR